MPFVTTLTFTSGDRHTLESVVADIKESATRKGVELKGPHPEPPTEQAVDLSARLLADDDAIDRWRYSVYTRTITIVGHDEFARAITERDLPDAVHLEAEIERRSSVG
ncbi:uS10/mL48 family ribosomal protein [Halococcoides cellulosivorans]|uniref:Small ribosomal subunit protein uS10 n=1 Tax=Halococcoides cellulosivorans TaxID=1679096 RepID=A0A2R4X067_9EURY|nr:uS10/mL48 family ribosomal protein [Halococcoides cellulosivorans]AWB27188.1 30S ribosomal protein S10 [Halococcoides cellulosivorans]